MIDPELKEYLDSMRAELKADIGRVETALLTAFHSWASPMEKRARSHAAAIRALDIEMESVAGRVQKLEDRK